MFLLCHFRITRIRTYVLNLVLSRLISVSNSFCFFIRLLHQILICLDLHSFFLISILFILWSIAGIIISIEKFSSSNWILQSYIQLCHFCIMSRDRNRLRLSNSLLQIVHKQKKNRKFLFSISYRYCFLLSVECLTCLIGRARTSSSTHQLAKCQHTLKLRYRAKRNSQPFILYHFFYVHSGRIDVYNNQVCNNLRQNSHLLLLLFLLLFDLKEKKTR